MQTTKLRKEIPFRKPRLRGKNLSTKKCMISLPPANNNPAVYNSANIAQTINHMNYDATEFSYIPQAEKNAGIIGAARESSQLRNRGA